MQYYTILASHRLEKIYDEREIGGVSAQGESDERYTAQDISLDTQTIDKFYPE